MARRNPFDLADEMSSEDEDFRNGDVPDSCKPGLVGLVDVDALISSGSTTKPFFARPLIGDLLITNEASDARDHCANERTFLSYLKLSLYTTIVAVAIVLSFHLKSTPTPLELRLATPLGCIFWLLSVAVLGVGLGNYIDTCNKFGMKTALVQSGWRTQVVIGGMAVSIMGTCVILLVVTASGSVKQTGVLDMLGFPEVEVDW